MRAGLIGLAFCWLVATPALACPNIPAVGLAIDGLLKQTKLKETDRRKVEDLQKQMTALAAAGNAEGCTQGGRGRHASPRLREGVAQVRAGDVHVDEDPGRGRHSSGACAEAVMDGRH